MASKGRSSVTPSNGSRHNGGGGSTSSSASAAHQLAIREAVASIPAPAIVWSYSSDSDEPSYIPYAYTRTSSGSLVPASTATSSRSFDNQHRNHPNHPLHPQFGYQSTNGSTNAQDPSIPSAGGAGASGTSSATSTTTTASTSVSSMQSPSSPTASVSASGSGSSTRSGPRVSERVKAREELATNPDRLNKALDLAHKKRTARASQKRNWEKRRRYFEALVHAHRKGGGGGGDGSGRGGSSYDGYYEDGAGDGVGFDLSHTLGRFSARRRMLCLYLLSSLVFLSGLAMTWTFASVSDTSFSFPKLYFTSAGLGVLIMLSALIGFVGAFTNRVDVLYGFAGVTATLGFISGFVGLMGITETDANIIAVVLTHALPAAPPPALIDECLRNARIMSLSVLTAVAVIGLTCFILYRLRRVLLSESRAVVERGGRMASSAFTEVPNNAPPSTSNFQYHQQQLQRHMQQQQQMQTGQQQYIASNTTPSSTFAPSTTATATYAAGLDLDLEAGSTVADAVTAPIGANGIFPTSPSHATVTATSTSVSPSFIYPHPALLEAPSPKRTGSGNNHTSNNNNNNGSGSGMLMSTSSSSSLSVATGGGGDVDVDVDAVGLELMPLR